MAIKNTKTKEGFKRYMLIDGNAIVHRAFHAIRHLSTKSGEPTNAVYGFAVILLGALQDIKPTHAAIAYDLEGPTFRHEQYQEYKAHRAKAADELYQQIPRTKEVAQGLGIPVFEQAGFEADDLIGTLACKIKEQNKDNDNYEILIVTGDLDFLQLVDDKVKVYALRQGITNIAVYDEKGVLDRYGITPVQFLDFKAIKGDPSDNIKGVKGIGEIGALSLIKEHGSIEGIYQNIDQLKEKTRQLFENQREDLKMAKELSRIVCDVPVNIEVPELRFDQVRHAEMSKLFQELEFKSLIPKLPKVEDGALVNVEVTEEKIGAKKENQKYFTIDTLEKLNELSNNLAKQEEFAFDTETEGLGALDYDLVGLSFSYKEGEAYYVPASLLLKHEFDGLRKVFADPNIKKIAHNIKYDYLVMKRFGVEINNLYCDTMIASYLLAPGSRSHDLDTAAFNEFGYEMQPIEELIGKGKKQISLKDVDVEKVAFYCCEDVDYTYRLKKALLPRLETEHLNKVFFEIEMPLIQILAEMEENGIVLDTKLFHSLEKKVAKELNDLEADIYKHAGEEFNINSPAQLKVILFDKIQIPIKGMFMKKTKSGFSTAASELEKMRGLHPIIDLILSYRELSKLQSTYIKALPELVSKDGRVHTSFNQTIAATGRLSSSNPNLQNIPIASGGVASEIRKGFVAAEGYELLSIDYSQIELRVVAHLSEDPTMTRVFKENRDIHTATAMQIYGVTDPSKVTKEMRRDAKTINFSVLYGVSSFGLSERSEMTRQEATEFIKRYFAAFPKVDQFLNNVVEETRTRGFVTNELGRKRYFPEISSSQFMVRAAAERAALNMPVQSLAADILKIAMQNITKEIDIQSDEIRLLLQVHDELVFEVRKDQVEKYAKSIHVIMEQAYKLKVPLVAEAKVGKSWGEMVELKF